MNMTSISINLKFAGILLPVQEYDGKPYIPLKPVTEVFGLSWKVQARKLRTDENRELFEVVTLQWGGQSGEMLSIPMELVTGFIGSLSPAQVKAGGNDSGAQFIIEKRKEWSRVAFQYEVDIGNISGVAATQESLRLKKMGMLINVSRTMHQNGGDPYLKAVQQELGNDLGFDIAIQQELPTGTAS